MPPLRLRFGVEVAATVDTGEVCGAEMYPHMKLRL